LAKNPDPNQTPTGGFGKKARPSYGILVEVEELNRPQNFPSFLAMDIFIDIIGFGGTGLRWDLNVY
jgi:hypothetical protein